MVIDVKKRSLIKFLTKNEEYLDEKIGGKKRWMVYEEEKGLKRKHLERLGILSFWELHEDIFNLFKMKLLISYLKNFKKALNFYF